LDQFIITYSQLAARKDSLSRNAEPVKAYDKVEQMPEFPGGNKELMKFINKNLEYPVFASAVNAQGMVVVGFVINREGKVTNPIILKSVHPDCDAEALRIIKLMPDWNPGIQDGKPVNVYFKLPFNFVLN